jgi:hypothetical protein
MSYSNLIQLASPAVVYALDDSNVGNSQPVAPDRFLYANPNGSGFYNGIYQNVSKVSFPIVYGGQQSIKVNENGYIRIPSFRKMSLSDVGNKSSLEFWVKISNSSSSEQVIMTKKDVDADGAVDYATCIYVKNDYITFRLGIESDYREVSVPLDSVNKPLHIVASYTPSDISLTVNGAKNTTTITNPQTLFPTFDLDDEYFYFQKPSGISNIQFDCIALYSYELARERLVRHFVYGCGYNPPAQFINSNGGALYNFSMDGQTTIKKYDFGPGNPWAVSETDNVSLERGNLILKSFQEPTIIQRGTLEERSLDLLFTTTGFDFNKTSYLELKNSDSIISHNLGGWVFKFNGSGVTLTTTKQTLFKSFSDTLQDSIEAYLIKVDSVDKLVFKINDVLVTQNAPTISEDFYVGYYTSGSNEYFIYGTASSTSNILVSTDKIKPLSFGTQKIRIGSDNTWVSDDVVPSEQFEFTGKLKEIRSISDGLITSSLLGNAVSSLKNQYTASPNSNQKRFVISSSGSAVVDIPQQALCPISSNTTGANRIDIGHPLGSTAMTLSISNIPYSEGVAGTARLASTSVTERTITSGDWLNNQLVQSNNPATNPVDIISFAISLSTDDLIRKPAKLSYLRLFSYQLTSDDNGTTNYVLCNASPGGNPAKIYLTGASKTVNIPDILETPILYNGFYSGLSLKNNYTEINHDRQSLEGGGIKVISFMLYFDSGQSSGTYKILDFDSLNPNNGFSVGSTGNITKGSNTSVYLNGNIASQASSILLDQWQQVTVVYTEELNKPLITIGNASASTGARIDQLILFAKPYDSNSGKDFVKNLYNLTAGGVSHRVQSTSVVGLSDEYRIPGIIGTQQEPGYGKVWLSDFTAEDVSGFVETAGDFSVLSLIDGSSEITIPVTGYYTVSQSQTFETTTTTNYGGSGSNTIQVIGAPESYFPGRTKLLRKITTAGTSPFTDITVTNAVSDGDYTNTTTLTLSSNVIANFSDFLVFSNEYFSFNQEQQRRLYLLNKKIFVGQTFVVNSGTKRYIYTVDQIFNVDNPIQQSPGYFKLKKETLDHTKNGKVYVGQYYNSTKRLQWVQPTSGDTGYFVNLASTNLFREKIKSKTAPSQDSIFTTEE